MKFLLLLAALFAFALAQVGCETAGTHSRSSEPTLAKQVADVRAGTSDRIQLTRTPVNDNDLAAIHELTGLRELLIDDARSCVTATGLEHLAGLAKLEHLRLRGTGCDDAALAEVARLPELRVLNVPRGEFTDAGLAELAKLVRLEQLRFGSPQVTDAGMKTLLELPALKRIHLIGIPLTDVALAELAQIEPLESLYIDDIAFSDAAWAELFRQRERLGRPLHVHIDEAHHDRDPRKHDHN